MPSLPAWRIAYNMELVSTHNDNCAEVITPHVAFGLESSDLPVVSEVNVRFSGKRSRSRWSRPWLASLGIHVGTAFAALQWIADDQPDLLSMQRGLAAIELVASIEAVEQTPEADEQPLEIKLEPVRSESLSPLVEPPRTPQALETRRVEMVDDPVEQAPPPPSVQPARSIIEPMAKTSPPPLPKRSPRPVDVPVEVVQVDSLATPMSQANEGIETPDELPRQVATNRPPNYPVEALAARVEGVVTVRATIDAAGVVAEVDVATSSGTASLDLAALNAVRNWRFAPARKAGLAIKTVVLVPVRFSIRRDS